MAKFDKPKNKEKNLQSFNSYKKSHSLQMNKNYTDTEFSRVNKDISNIGY